MLLFSLVALAWATECLEDEELVDGECIKKTCIGFNGLECTGYGKCTNGICLCDEGFVLEGTAKCIPITCIVDGQMCPNGLCQEVYGVWGCTCRPNHTPSGGRCIPNECVTGMFESGEAEICHTQGTCDIENKRCVCSYLYTGFHCNECSTNAEVLDGDKCVPYVCVHEDSSGNRSICGGHGKCIKFVASSAPDDFVYLCDCDVGYTNIFGDGCVSDHCIDPKYPTKECSNHGDCKDNSCVCMDNYSGRYCEIKQEN